jgi:hypothetical protein
MEASGRAISAHARLLNSGRNADLIRPEESTRLIMADVSQCRRIFVLANLYVSPLSLFL